MALQAYHVQWFIRRDALQDVTVRIRDGRLLDVESGCAPDAIELSSVALVDGLVNAHTHLEFSGLVSPIPSNGRFTDWIRAVVAQRRGVPADSIDAIHRGLQESLESGTTLIGEIATSAWFRDKDLQSDFHGVLFQEILGLLPDRVAGQCELARSHLNFDLDSVSMGISPHAAYSAHLDLVHEAVKLARHTGCPLAMHIAETRAELELLQNGTGEFREMLQDFGIWRDEFFPPGRRPMDYLKILAAAPRSLIIHGNYLEHDELLFLAKNPQMTLVYCPRTHAHFRHENHPWLRAKAMGVSVAIGTDSRASNPDLSIFAELQFLAQKHPELSHLKLLTLGSFAGRDALGFGQSDRPSLTLVQLDPGSCQNPERELFSPTNQVCGTMIEGEWVWRSADIRKLTEA